MLEVPVKGRENAVASFNYPPQMKKESDVFMQEEVEFLKNAELQFLSLQPHFGCLLFTT